MKNDFAIHIPWLMGIIGTRSLDKQIPGIIEIVETNAQRIRNGIPAVLALERLRENRQDSEALATLKAHEADLGFGLLLKAAVGNVAQASEADIQRVARQSVPRVAPMFWTFRIMVGLGFVMLALITWAFWHSVKGTFADKPVLLRAMFWAIPLPWIAIECGWFVAEYGRQPWAVYGVLPTPLSASSLSTTSLWWSIIGFTAFYTVLLVVMVFLMQRTIKHGPGILGTGRYDREVEAH